MSKNKLRIIKEGSDEFNDLCAIWNELNCFFMHAHYKCPQCGAKLIKIEVPRRTRMRRKRGVQLYSHRVLYISLYKCTKCNIFLKWKRIRGKGEKIDG